MDQRFAWRAQRGRLVALFSGAFVTTLMTGAIPAIAQTAQDVSPALVREQGGGGEAMVTGGLTPMDGLAAGSEGEAVVPPGTTADPMAGKGRSDLGTADTGTAAILGLATGAPSDAGDGIGGDGVPGLDDHGALTLDNPAETGETHDMGPDAPGEMGPSSPGEAAEGDKTGDHGDRDLAPGSAETPTIEAPATDGWSLDGDGATRHWQGGNARTGWLVTSEAPTAGVATGLQRYWLGADGSLVRDGLVDAGGGWYAHAKGDGTVVRGRWQDVDGTIYLADNDGRLLPVGWNVTSAFDGGLQRYWVDPETHGCVPGYSTAGWAHVTRADTGYVVRGAWRAPEGMWYFADNDGRAPSGGWVVTDAYGQGLQRYWIDPATHAAHGGYSAAGGGHVTRSDTGYVVRGAWRAPEGMWYFADNDGRAPQVSGWLVSSAYGQGLQRYWIDGSSHASWPGFSWEGYAHYTRSDTGYVARGRVAVDGIVVNANNDGLVSHYGWQNPAWMYQVSSWNVGLPGAAYSTPFSYVTPSRVTISASRSQCVEAFVSRAYEYLGTPYVWNYSRQPGVGVDCIGLVYQCAYACGMDLGEFNPYDHFYSGPNGWHSHDANNMWNYGAIQRLSLGARQRGDLIFWNGHVAIYVGGDTIIEAPGAGGRVRLASLWTYGTPKGVGRLFA